ncbi:hypothetical protein D3C86_1883240 [compost metagenome]
MDKEEKDMPPETKAKPIKKSISDHPNYKSRVPRLEVAKGVAQINENDPLQKKWFEEFKK